MPCLEVTLPKMDLATRRRLAERLTETFVASTGIDRQAFCIFFHEYVGGSLWESGNRPPPIHLALYSPRVKRTVKGRLVKQFTAIVTEFWPGWVENVIVHIGEHPYENVGYQGKTLADQYTELAERPFYYPLE
jgi:phenylpyruvate tautomerase PptA (4-oxalocrotonate tautomerase family)